MMTPHNQPSSVASISAAFGRNASPVGMSGTSRISATSAARNTWRDPASLRNGPVGVQEKRRRRRVNVPSMYSSAVLRNLALKSGPIEAYVVDLSETGLAVEADSLVPVGQIVTVEFQIAGVGTLRGDSWPIYVAAAEVVRHDLLDDFPGGPYRMGLRFVKVPTMAQGQIARYVATHTA